MNNKKYGNTERKKMLIFFRGNQETFHGRVHKGRKSERKIMDLGNYGK